MVGIFMFLSFGVVAIATVFFVGFGILFLIEFFEERKVERLQFKIAKGSKNKEKLQEKLDTIDTTRVGVEPGLVDILKVVFKVIVAATAICIICTGIIHKVKVTYQYTTRELVNETKVGEVENADNIVSMIVKKQNTKVTIVTTDEKETMLKEYNIKKRLSINKTLSNVLFLNLVNSDETEYELLVPKK